MAFEDDKEIALQVVKMWLKEQDAVYLAKENRIVYWLAYNPESKSGEWVKLKLTETVRIIKATRAGFTAMRFINPELIMMAAQEEGRAYKQGVRSRSTVPDEYFNLEKAGHFNSFETLTLCTLQTLVGRGWNTESLALGKLMDYVFYLKGFATPNRNYRWRLIRAVADEAGMLVRDRKDRLTVYKVGRFVCVQIDGIDDSIKLDFTQEELDSLAEEILLKYLSFS